MAAQRSSLFGDDDMFGDDQAADDVDDLLASALKKKQAAPAVAPVAAAAPSPVFASATSKPKFSAATQMMFAAQPAAAADDDDDDEMAGGLFGTPAKKPRSAAATPAPAAAVVTPKQQRGMFDAPTNDVSMAIAASSTSTPVVAVATPPPATFSKKANAKVAALGAGLAAIMGGGAPTPIASVRASRRSGASLTVDDGAHSSGARAAVSSSSDDPFGMIEDDGMRERMRMFVGELKSGKSAKAISSVLKGMVPPHIRAIVFAQAGMIDPLEVSDEATAAAPLSAAPPPSSQQAQQHARNPSMVVVQGLTVATDSPRLIAAAPPSSSSSAGIGGIGSMASLPSFAALGPSPDSPIQAPRVAAQLPPDIDEDDERDDDAAAEEEREKRKRRKKEKKEKEKRKVAKERERDERKKKEESDRLVSEEQQRRNQIEKKQADDDRVTALDLMNSDDKQFQHEPHKYLPILFMVGALASADLSIIFPSLYGYIDSLQHSYLYYGMLAAAFNVGQMISTLFMGPWADNRSIKEVLLFSTTCSLAGNLVYLLNNGDDNLLIVGRLIAGCGAGTVFIAYAHITRVSKRGAERDRRLLAYSWITRSTQIIAPAIGSLGSLLHNQTIAGIFFTKYTFPSCVMVLLFGLMFIGQFIHFWATPRHKPQHFYSQRIDEDDMDSGRVKFGSDGLWRKDSFALLFVYFSIILSYWTFTSGVFAFIEDTFNWSITRAYIFHLFTGVVFSLAFGLMQIIRGHVTEAKLLSAALALVTLGGILLLKFDVEDIEEWQIWAAGATISCGFSLAVVLVPAMFASMTGVQVEYLGIRMAPFFFMAASGTAIGPVAGAFFVDKSGMHLLGLVVTGVMIVVMAVIIIRPIEATDRVQAKIVDEGAGLKQSLLSPVARTTTSARPDHFV